MLWLKLVNYVKTALATNNLIVGADLFDTCTYFHVRIVLLFRVHDTLLIVDTVAVELPLD